MESYVGPGALVSLVGAGLRLAPEAYGGVAEEPAATKMCLAVAFIAGAASAPVLGPAAGVGLPLALVFGIVLTLGILVIEAAIGWAAARLLLSPRRTFGAFVRPLAVGHAPRLGYLLVPALGLPPWLALTVSVWLIAAFVVAMKAATAQGWGIAVGFALFVGVVRWVAS